MKKIKNLICFVIIMLVSLFLLTGCSEEEKSLERKTEDEIAYMDAKILAMMNRINNISLSNEVLIQEKEEMSKDSSKNSSSEGSNSQDGQNENSENSSGLNEEKIVKYDVKNASILTKENTQIDWESLKNSIETINNSWSTMIMDLHGLNINNEDLLKCSNIIDQATISIKDENKMNTLINLANIYAYLPAYLKECCQEEQKIKIEQVKSNLINCYVLVEQERWDDMKGQIASAITTITSIMNSTNAQENSNNNLSKIYVMLNELNNSLSLKDKEIFYMKYKNVMQELINL